MYYSYSELPTQCEWAPVFEHALFSPTSRPTSSLAGFNYQRLRQSQIIYNKVSRNLLEQSTFVRRLRQPAYRASFFCKPYPTLVP